MSNLYCDITNSSNILSVNLSMSHGTSCSLATCKVRNTSLDIGEDIIIDLGYTTDHSVMFSGYVKEITKNVPDNTYEITALDTLSRAVDYFIVSTNPDSPWTAPLSYETAHIVRDLLELAGIPSGNIHHQDTGFLMGINTPVEVNLVSSYDYSKFLGDLTTWHLWADVNGEVYFKNRKPFLMTHWYDDQPGYVEDIPDNSVNPTTPLNDSQIFKFSYNRSEKNLRNKVVVYGSSGVYGEAHQAQSYDPVLDDYIQILPTTPTQFYKAAAVGTVIIQDTATAEDCAAYNLKLYNRIDVKIICTVEGNNIYVPHNTLRLDEDVIGIEGLWYIYGAEHSWSSSGYTTSLEINK